MPSLTFLQPDPNFSQKPSSTPKNQTIEGLSAFPRIFSKCEVSIHSTKIQLPEDDVYKVLSQLYLIKIMNQFDQRKLVLIKFQPQQVLFMHRETRVIYRYYNLTQAVENYPQIECDILLRGVIFNQGVLYEKEQSTLKQEIAQRNRSFKKEYFSEEEIVNTFVPLFEGLKQLHDEGVVHGGITLDSIVIVEGEVRLRDWLGNTNETRSLQKSDDWRALGQCMLNCTFLNASKTPNTDLQKLIPELLPKMSKSFMLAIIIFIKELKTCYKNVCSVLAGQSKHVDTKLLEMYQGLKAPQKKKKSLQNQIGEPKPVLTFSPAKKFGLTHKRVIHHQNIQNKLDGGDIKKFERSRINQKNSPVHELMNKRLNEQQKKIKEETLKRGKDKIPIINLSNFGVENNSKRFGLKDRSSPMQKLRSFSKKK